MIELSFLTFVFHVPDIYPSDNGPLHSMHSFQGKVSSFETFDDWEELSTLSPNIITLIFIL